MPLTATLTPVPAAAPVESRHMDPRQWLAPDAGFTRTWCGETVPDTQDAVTAHERECTECQRELVGP